jgi:mannosylglycoprotein endo-beta-mannosidase
MLEEEELYWLKRSHENWLLKGDNNTKFFHKIANGKKENTIISFNDQDMVIEWDENLLQHATNYYKELFGQGDGNILPLDPDMWKEGEKVTQTENEDITKLFSEIEIKEALFQMETNKAAGPDNIPIEFY